MTITHRNWKIFRHEKKEVILRAFLKEVCTAKISEVEDWLQNDLFEVDEIVIKPPKSASTDGVIKVSLKSDWKKEFNQLLGKTNRLGIINDELVVQECLYGCEYVVDTVSYGKKHSITNICKYNKIITKKNIGIYDSMEWLSPDIALYNDLKSYAFSVLDALGVHFGPAHIEIMHTKTGLRLIEVGARAHGGGHPNFNLMATRDSQIDRTVRAIIEKNIDKEGYYLFKNMMVVFLISKNQGVVTNVEILDEIKKFKSYHHARINFKNGDYIMPTNDLFSTMALGFVVLCDEDKSQIKRDYGRIRLLEQNLRFNNEHTSKVSEIA